jgi:hypothetical protein
MKCPAASGLTVWSESSHLGFNCVSDATFEEAANVCISTGARLCTAAEMSAGCTAGTGCGHDDDMIWTSTDLHSCPAGAAVADGSSCNEAANAIHLIDIVGGVCAAGACTGGVPPAVIIAGVLDLTVPEAGANGKAIELRAVADVADLSAYAVGVANNGGGTDGMETETLPAIPLAAGQSHWLLRNPVVYAAYFGADSVFATGVEGVDYSVHAGISQNGDDAIELFLSGAVVDIYGDIDVDGTGTAWEYIDAFATRNAGSEPSATFDITQWAIQVGFGRFVALYYRPSYLYISYFQRDLVPLLLKRQ